MLGEKDVLLQVEIHTNIYNSYSLPTNKKVKVSIVLISQIDEGEIAEE